MNELTLTELDMGGSVPQIMSTSHPEVNDRGEATLRLKDTHILIRTRQRKMSKNAS